jgi:DNA-binding FadR family transcriptional regulator
LLALSGATLADVMTARTAIEPQAAKLLAEEGTAQAHEELARLVDDIPREWEAGRLGPATANLHRRMVELSGNATMGMIAGMLHEITERHTAAAFSGVQNMVPKAQYNKVVKSYHRLVDLVVARKGAEAETHWRRHMEAASAALLKGHEKTRVRDIMD